MNVTSVSEVMKKLDQYVPAKTDKGKTPETPIDPGLRQAITEQIESGATNIQNDESKPAVYEIKYNGKIYTVEMGVLGQPRILETGG
jgi:hypothetical protein